MGTSDASDASRDVLQADSDALDNVFSHVYARLIKNRRLRRSKQELQIPAVAILYAPNLTRQPTGWDFDDTQLAVTDNQIKRLIQDRRLEISEELFTETISTLEGAKGLIRPSKHALFRNIALFAVFSHCGSLDPSQFATLGVKGLLNNI
jgi:hypothetical protein